MNQDEALHAVQEVIDRIARLERIAGREIRFDVPIADQFTPHEIQNLARAIEQDK